MISFKPEQLLKAYLSITVTVSGILTVVRLVTPSKIYSGILTLPSSKTTSFTPEYRKGLLLIFVRVAGIVTEVRLSQP